MEKSHYCLTYWTLNQRKNQVFGSISPAPLELHSIIFRAFHRVWLTVLLAVNIDFPLDYGFWARNKTQKLLPAWLEAESRSTLYYNDRKPSMFLHAQGCLRLIMIRNSVLIQASDVN